MSPPVVVVTGSTGLIGSALVRELERTGHRVRRLVRHPPRSADERRWDPGAGTIEAGALEDARAVVHLAGENIGHRWTRARRRRIVESRALGTSLVARAVAAAGTPVLVSASAVGIYGDRDDEVLDESSAPGGGFLADVCRQWEAAANGAATHGTRVVTIRTGIVMTPGGGALQRLLLPFRLGVGGRLGSGRQWMSWITLDDHVRAVMHALGSTSLAGPVNLTSPGPVTNRDLTRALAHAVHRWAVFPVPAFALRLLFGQMADETLLAGQRVLPKQLIADGFTFHSPAIDDAFASLLREPLRP